VFEGQFLAFYTALLSLTSPISFYWIIAPPFLPTKCFFALVMIDETRVCLFVIVVVASAL
jgi:hypothetical protein